MVKDQVIVLNGPNSTAVGKEEWSAVLRDAMSNNVKRSFQHRPTSSNVPLSEEGEEFDAGREAESDILSKEIPSAVDNTQLGKWMN